MNNPDSILADIRGALAYAPQINDLETRMRWLLVYRDKAASALILDLLATEQRDAVTAMMQLVQAAIDETALQLPPALSTLEAA